MMKSDIARACHLSKIDQSTRFQDFDNIFLYTKLFHFVYGSSGISPWYYTDLSRYLHLKARNFCLSLLLTVHVSEL